MHAVTRRPSRRCSSATRRLTLVVALAVLGFVAVACEAEGDWVDTAPVAQGQRLDSAALSGVSCSTPTSCVAVGWNHAAVLTPTGWADATVTGMSDFDDVSCGATTLCLSPGRINGVNRPSIWNGTTWAPAPDPTGFFDVYGGWNRYISSFSCAGATFCVVEFADENIKKRALFDGSSWEWMAPDAFAPDSYSKLSCSSSSHCLMITGWLDSVQATQWNGTSWSAAPSPGWVPAYFDCASATYCVAGGYVSSGGSQLARFDGTAWTPLTLPGGLQPGEIGDATCGATGSCRFLVLPVDGSASFTLSLAGDTWSTQALPNGNDAHFSNIECASATACVGVGFAQDQYFGYYRTTTNLVGSAWSDPSATFPQYTVPDGGFWSVDCGSDTSCTAFGYAYEDSHYIAQAQTWNGTTWSTVALPGLTADQMDVSCSDADFCVAVGLRELSPQFDGKPQILVRQGGAWQRFDVSGLVTTSNFERVSCASTTFCVARSYEGFARWDGTAWTTLAGPSLDIDDISCVSASWCMGVGRTTWNGFTVPAFYEWDGTTWTPTIPPQVDGENPIFVRVDCTTPDACVGVGYTADSNSPAVAWWNGTEWVGNRTTKSNQDIGAVLTDVGCSAGGACAAVGADYATNHPLVQITTNPAERVWKPAPEAAELTDSIYFSVSAVACRPAWCMAVGSFSDPANETVPWAARFVLA